MYDDGTMRTCYGIKYDDVGLNGFPQMLSENVIRPIPLTPEILEKMGFVLEGSEAGDDGAYELVIEAYDISFLLIQKAGEYMTEESVGLWIQNPLRYSEGFKIDISRVAHVHELQNIYFCIVGSELIFDLNN